MTANTTITAATVIAFVNNGTNSTSYSTKFNTELGGFTLPQTTNAQGTVTVSAKGIISARICSTKQD